MWLPENRKNSYQIALSIKYDCFLKHFPRFSILKSFLSFFFWDGSGTHPSYVARSSGSVKKWYLFCGFSMKGKIQSNRMLNQACKILSSISFMSEELIVNCLISSMHIEGRKSFNLLQYGIRFIWMYQSGLVHASRNAIFFYLHSCLFLSLCNFYILIIWEAISFMWKITFQIFIKSRCFEKLWVSKKQNCFFQIDLQLCCWPFFHKSYIFCLLMKNIIFESKCSSNGYKIKIERNLYVNDILVEHRARRPNCSRRAQTCERSVT